VFTKRTHVIRASLFQKPAILKESHQKPLRKPIGLICFTTASEATVPTIIITTQNFQYPPFPTMRKTTPVLAKDLNRVCSIIKRRRFSWQRMHEGCLSNKTLPTRMIFACLPTATKIKGTCWRVNRFRRDKFWIRSIANL